MDGRLLTCTSCRDTLRVYELPGEFIDPDLYTCGECKRPVERDAPRQLALGSAAVGLREETVEYDPLMSQIPF